MADRVITVPQATQIAQATKRQLTELNGRLTEQNTKFTSMAGKYYGVVASASAAETKGITDLNALENGSAIMLVWNTVSTDIANFPTNFSAGAFVYTKSVVDALNTTASNMVQYAISITGEIATRVKTGGNWKAWKYYANRDIYDSALQHYGYCWSASRLAAPYDDCNTLPKNSVYTYVGFEARTAVAHYPAEFTTGATIITFSGATNDYGNAQIAVETGSAFRMAFRILKQPSQWTSWSYIQSSNMQNMVDFSMFEDFGVVGDSFASGSTYYNGAWVSNGYPHSWGQVLARMTGSKCVNYSKGGLSTRTWLTDSMGLPLLLSKPANQLYILALGINDATLTASAYLGDATDMDDPENHDTFYGNYAKIINAIKGHAPDAKIMIMEILGSAGDRPQFNVAVRNIAEHFDIPLIVPSKSYYMTTGIFWSTMSNGHPIAATYAGMARAMKGIIEDLIASSPTDYAVIPTSNYAVSD